MSKRATSRGNGSGSFRRPSDPRASAGHRRSEALAVMRSLGAAPIGAAAIIGRQVAPGVTTLIESDAAPRADYSAPIRGLPAAASTRPAFVAYLR